jgi:hypothetical protein
VKDARREQWERIWGMASSGRSAELGYFKGQWLRINPRGAVKAPNTTNDSETGQQNNEAQGEAASNVEHW